jgi:hypothetical protein
LHKSAPPVTSIHKDLLNHTRITTVIMT